MQQRAIVCSLNGVTVLELEFKSTMRIAKLRRGYRPDFEPDFSRRFLRTINTACSDAKRGSRLTTRLRISSRSRQLKRDY